MDLVERPEKVLVYAQYADGRIEAWQLFGGALKRPELDEKAEEDIETRWPPTALPRRSLVMKIPFNQAQYAPSLRNNVPDRQGCTCDGPVHLIAGIIHQSWCARKTHL